MRWEIKQSFDGQLYQEYSYQNLLKLDHFSSSYDEKNFGVFFYASQCSIVMVSLYIVVKITRSLNFNMLSI